MAAAFAADVVTAALASPAVDEVFVVTDEPEFRPGGAILLPDEGEGDLNRALQRAASRVRADTPGRPLAALCADVPCLRADDLTAALQWQGSRRWFVADADGSGTTLLAALDELDPHFGPGSAARHASSGATALTAPLTSLRRDVDTVEDLALARTLGVGNATAAALPSGSAAAAVGL